MIDFLAMNLILLERLCKSLEAISVHFKADPPCTIGAVWELIQHYNTKPKRSGDATGKQRFNAKLPNLETFLSL